MKSLFFVFIVLSMTCFAQLDTLDRVDLKNNQFYTGKVIKVTSNTVQFRESVTNLLHEFNKSEIRDLKLSNGVTVTFDNTAAPIGQQQNVTGSARTETQTQNPPPTQQQNPPQQNPAQQQNPTQGQTVESGRTQTGTATGQTESKSQTEGKSQTENKGQQSQNAAAPAPAEDGSSSKMDTSMIIVLAAGGLVALLLIGALIF